VNQGARYDLTRDLANIANDNCALQSTTIINPSSFAPAQLNIGDNQITVMAIDINGNDHTCSYNIKVLPIGACCGVLGVGCIDKVVLAKCPEGGFWKADTKCSEDCGKIYELLLGRGETFSQYSALIGSCCRAGGCKVTPKHNCKKESFTAGDHTCDAHCGACCGGDVDNNCQNDYTRRQCIADNGQFKVNGVCANDCGKLESVY
jgi:hypothetical protein